MARRWPSTSFSETSSSNTGSAFARRSSPTGALVLYLAAAKDAFISRTVLAVNLPLLYLGLFGSNYFLPQILAHVIFGEDRAERALLVGSAADARRLSAWLKSKRVFGFRAVGIVSDPGEAAVPGLPWLGESSDLERILTEQRITQVILLELPESARHTSGSSKFWKITARASSF